MTKKPKKHKKQAKSKKNNDSGLAVVDERKVIDTKLPKLTDKQRRFCAEYIIDLNATQAALRAGYSAKCVNAIGPRMLVKVGIQDKIQKLKVKRSQKTGLTAEYVIQMFKDIADANKIKRPIVAVRALEQLGKHLGIYERDNEQKALNIIDILAIVGINNAG